MAITRAPTGQDLTCLVCHKQAQDIDHVVNRGMGGSKKRDVPENKVPLCRECHELKTLGHIESYTDKGGYGEYWYHWRKKGSEIWINTEVEVSQRYKCLIERSLEEERDGGVPHSVDAGLGVGVGDGVSGAHAPPLTHEQRVAIAKEIKDTEWNRQWIAGDTANIWREEIGEEAEQYISDFGYVQESIANIMRVCEKIPPPFRNGNLRFGHHVVVAGENLEDVEMHLAECVEQGWSVAEFRRQRKGTKPKVKRYTLDELRELAHGWDDTSSLPDGAAVMPSDIWKFLDWLGEQG